MPGRPNQVQTIRKDKNSISESLICEINDSYADIDCKVNWCCNFKLYGHAIVCSRHLKKSAGRVSL